MGSPPLLWFLLPLTLLLCPLLSTLLLLVFLSRKSLLLWLFPLLPVRRLLRLLPRRRDLQFLPLLCLPPPRPCLQSLVLIPFLLLESTGHLGNRRKEREKNETPLPVGWCRLTVIVNRPL